MEERELTDAEAREVARRMIAEAGTPPDADFAAENNATALDAPSGRSQSMADANEDRIERALVELGAVPPHALSDAEPGAAGEPPPDHLG